MGKSQMSRRKFIQSTAIAGTATATGGFSMASDAKATKRSSENAGGSAMQTSKPAQQVATKGTIVAHDNTNIVETTSGEVRGSQRNGIHIFRGIPYGATTGGRNRFLPAMKVEPWPGVRSAQWYEHVCPYPPRASWADDESAFLFQWDDGQPGEDCLRVNIWTPGD